MSKPTTKEMLKWLDEIEREKVQQMELVVMPEFRKHALDRARNNFRAIRERIERKVTRKQIMNHILEHLGEPKEKKYTPDKRYSGMRLMSLVKTILTELGIEVTDE